jgi:hypothetical protein
VNGIGMDAGRSAQATQKKQNQGQRASAEPPQNNRTKLKEQVQSHPLFEHHRFRRPRFAHRVQIKIHLEQLPAVEFVVVEFTEGLFNEDLEVF